MATKLGSLLIELGLDSAKFRSGTRKAQREMSTFQRGMSGSANLVKGALAGMVAALSVDMFATAIKNGLEYASSLGEVAQQLGVTTDTLQEYRYAATQVGLTQDEMDNSLAKLTRTIGQAANGGKAQAAAFDRLGVSIRDAGGNIKDAGTLIPEIADGLKTLGSDAQRAATLTELFGRAGQKLAPLLSGGSTEVNNLRDAAQRLGIVLSSEQIAKADETADKLAAIKTVLQARIAGVVADNADSIVTLTDALANLTTESIRFAAQGVTAWRQLGFELDRLSANIARNLPGVSDAVRAGADAELNRIDREQFGGERVRLNPAPAGHIPGTPYNTPAPSSRGALITRPTRPVIPGPYQRTRNFNDDLADQSLNGAPAIIRETIAATTTAVPALRAMTDEVRSLLDQLNPVAAGARELAANTKLLDDALKAGQLSVQQHTVAIAQLRAQYGAFGEGITDWREIIGDVADGLALDVPSTDQILGDLADHWEGQAQRMTEAAERQKQALFDTLGSIRNFASSLKSGDIVGIFESILGLLEGIGGITGGFKIGGMSFGSGASSRIPGFANGTNFAPGGLAWVGERGRELVNLPRGSTVTPNHELAGMGGSTVQVIPSPYFNVVVDGRIQGAAPSIAAAGSQGAQVAMARRSTRRLA